jgi:hypothetical protein
MPNSEYISANHPVIEISLAITRRTIHFCVQDVRYNAVAGRQRAYVRVRKVGGCTSGKY